MSSNMLGFLSATPLTARGGVASRRSVTERRPTVMASIAITTALKPCSHNIVVKQAEASDKTAGGIILPNEAQERPNLGEAIDVGPGKFFGNGVKIPMHISKGDKIIYGKYGGTEISLDGENLTVVTQDDVLCKVEGDSSDPNSVIPIFDRVLIRVEDVAEKRESSIIISDNAKTKPTSGTVVSIGPGRFMENGELEPVDIAVGDRVYYGTYAGTAVELDGGDYVVARIADIFAKL